MVDGYLLAEKWNLERAILPQASFRLAPHESRRKTVHSRTYQPQKVTGIFFVYMGKTA